jgi:hypothetical protein
MFTAAISASSLGIWNGFQVVHQKDLRQKKLNLKE